MQTKYKNTNGILHCRKFPTSIALTSDNMIEGNDFSTTTIWRHSVNLFLDKYQYLRALQPPNMTKKSSS